MSSPDSERQRTTPATRAPAHNRATRRPQNTTQSPPQTQMATLSNNDNTNHNPTEAHRTRESKNGTRSAHRQIEPDLVPLLEQFLTNYDEPTPDNGREDELNEMFSNQIFHASSRYKGPKVSEGYEELVASQHPLQVIYPDRYNTTGLAYSATSYSMKETHNPTALKKKTTFCCCIPLPDRDYDPMVMYSTDNPQVYELYRYKITHVALWFIALLTLMMAILILLISPFDFNDYSFFLHHRPIGYDVCNIITCCLGILILILGVVTKNPRIIIVFMVVFAIDAFVNLLRLYSVLQFLYFLLQLALIFVSNFYRILISAQWYYSL